MLKEGDLKVTAGVIVVLVLIGVAELIGWITFVAIAGGAVYIIRQYTRVQRAKEEKNKELARAREAVVAKYAPCEHGIMGANLAPDKCAFCLADLAA
jgi:hypothetical protein